MLTLMIAEDEFLERQALSKIIGKEFEGEIKIVAEVSNGPEAVRRAKQYRPDIIVMDISLPGINGIEAQKEILNFLPETATIFISAYSHFSYIKMAMQSKARDYLLKPVRTSSLLEAIKGVVVDLNGVKSYSIQAGVPGKEPKTDIIRDAVLYMNTNYREKIDLQSISNYIHMNPQYFSRIFKKEMNVSCVDYLNVLRVNYACELLGTTTYPAYRVAVESGFADPSYFSRVFSKYIQQTPTEYRRKYCEERVMCS